MIAIRRVLDPLEIEETRLTIYQNRAKNQPLISDILEECIKNVFNCFAFKESFCHLDSYGKLSTKVYLKNVGHIGKHFEKYSINVYNGDIVGSQVRLFKKYVELHCTSKTIVCQWYKVFYR